MSHAGMVSKVARWPRSSSSRGALSLRLPSVKHWRRGPDRDRVIRDLAVMLAGGGECVSDVGAVRDQNALFGPVASDSTAFRTVARIAADSVADRCAAGGARAGAGAVLGSALARRSR